MAYVHTLLVRWSDCDMYQHVNNAVYLTYFEEARGHFWREAMAEAFVGYDFIIAENLCTYRSPAKLAETLDIAVSVTHLGTKSFHLGYRITAREDGREVATGRTVQVMYDHATGTPIALSQDVRRRMLPYLPPAATEQDL